MEQEVEEVFDQLDLSDIKTGLDRFLDKASKVFSWLIMISMLISVYEVFMRYVLNSPTKWVHETTILLVSAFFVLGGIVSLARGRHIRVRLIYDQLSVKKQRMLDLSNAILSSIYFVMLSYASWLTFKKTIFAPDGSFYLEGSGSAWNPPFPPLIRFSVLLAACLMLTQSIVHIVHFIRKKDEVA